MISHLRYPIEDSTQVSAARRGVSDLAARVGLDEVSVAHAALVVTEAATNILKHAERGEILVRPLDGIEGGSLEMLAVDGGPGVANLGLSMIDGHSTTGTAGTGLGAIRRHSRALSMHAAPGRGFLLRAVLGNAEPEANRFHSGAVCVPKPGEEVAGDDWTCLRVGQCLLCVVADGLGHGHEAREAAATAIATAVAHPTLRLNDLLQLMHAALRPTRGAAVGIALIDPEKGVLCYAGIGNISATVIGRERNSQLISLNGIVGHNARRVNEVQCAWTSDCALLMHSDGLTGRWNRDDYLRVAAVHPSLAAAALYRDQWRQRDDVTVLVARPVTGSA